MTRIALLFPLVALTACSDMGSLSRPEPAPAAPAAPVAPLAAPAALGQGVAAAALDQTTAEERAAAVAAPAPAGAEELGKVTVALGSPTEQGFWLKSGLVKTAGKGRVELASGGSVAVDLIPGEGAGLLSLAAYRALGLGLTDLPEVTVFAD